MVCVVSTDEGVRMRVIGLDVQVHSLSSPGTQAEADATAAEDPTRFAGFAALPLQDTADVLEELVLMQDAEATEALGGAAPCANPRPARAEAVAALLRAALRGERPVTAAA